MSNFDAAISVGGLTEYLKSLLEDDEQLQQIWIWGEVTSAKEHPSGLFFTLTDPDVDAAINCVVWGNLRAKLRDRPSRGLKVAVLGSLSLYPKRGDYRFRAVQVCTLGAGLQELRRKQLRSRLAAEGLFDPLDKLPLPENPRTIAVVTSPTAAAWGDIQRTLQARQPGLHVLFSPAIVQGKQAPGSIAQALHRIELDDRAEVIILARGGGATEDLDCFDDEQVVRAIYHCQRPVVTGIGHERDQSLADLVADVAMHTPTAAAERVVPDALQRYREHIERKTKLIRLAAAYLQQAQSQVASLKARLQKVPTQARSLQRTQNRHELLREKLQALDPEAVLKRGYALVSQENGEIVQASQDVAIGDPLLVRLATGQVRVTVDAVDPVWGSLASQGNCAREGS
jgi:exodeoxyribonuclease VII large subunit